MIEQRRLGSTGLYVSRLALGMMSFGDTSRRQWVLDETAAEPIVRRAIEGGITFFDTADMYAAGASEVVTGRLLPKLISRDEAVVATKVYYPTTAGPNGRGLSRKHVLAAIDASLTRLRMDYVDLYQIHRWDPETPIEETMEALHDIVGRQGALHRRKHDGRVAIREGAGVAERNGWTRFVSMQNHYNLLHREEEREMIPLCVDQGIAVVPYSPLARGFLARAATSRDDIGSVRRDSGSRSGRSLRAGQGRRRAPGGRGLRRRTGRAACAGCPGVAAAEAGGDGADRRSDEDRPRRGRACGSRADARQ